MSEWMDAEAHVDRALEMFERGRWAEAEYELRKAISLNPDQAEWHFNLGLTLEAAGREGDALQSFEQAMQLMPELPDPLVAAGALAIRLGQFDKAIAWLKRAIRLDASLEAAYAHAIEAHVRTGNHDEAETMFYLAQHALPQPSAVCLATMAESLIQRQVFQRAGWCLQEALRLEPNMPRLRARLALVAASTGKPQRALQLYLRELRDDPGNIDTLLDYGELLREIGRLPEASEKFRRVLELEPANVDAHFALGQIALNTQRFEQSHLEFELVFKLQPQFPGVRCALGQALLHRGRIGDARVCLLEEFEAVTSTGEKENPTPQAPATDIAGQSDRRQHLAGLLLEVHEPARAAELLELALKSEGPNARLLRQLALARFRSGNRAAGIAASQRVLRLEPDCLRSIHNLALAALEDHEPDLAAGWVRRGLRINRQDEGLRRLRMRVWLARASRVWRRIWTFNINNEN